MATSASSWLIRAALVFARQKFQFGVAFGFALGCLFCALVSLVFPTPARAHPDQVSKPTPHRASLEHRVQSLALDHQGWGLQQMAA